MPPKAMSRTCGSPPCACCSSFPKISAQRTLVKNYWRAIEADPVGVHYAVRILVGGTALWLLLHYLADPNPVLVISSMIACTEPPLQSTLINFQARLANTCIGGAMGLVFVLVAGPRHVVLPLALGAARPFWSLRMCSRCRGTGGERPPPPHSSLHSAWSANQERSA